MAKASCGGDPALKHANVRNVVQSLLKLNPQAGMSYIQGDMG